MKTKDIAEGLLILANYYTNPDGYHVDASHDVLYVQATDRPVEQHALEQLVAIGWFQENVDRGDAMEYAAAHYDPDEGWTCYV